MYFALLDLLRFFSALSVLSVHTFKMQYGGLGVYLFFIVSGFVIYFSLNKGIKDYIISRFLRLYPMFWICCVITFLVTIMYGVNVPFKNFVLNLFMFNDGKIDSLVDGSYWTLTYELLFYFFIGVFTWIFSVKRLEWFYVSWLSISFLSFFFKIDQIFFIKLLSVRFVPYFVFGGMLALIIDRFKTSSSWMKVLYVGTLLVSSMMPIYISQKLQEQKYTIANFTGSFGSIQELMIVESFFIVVPIFVFLSYFVSSKKFTKVCFLLGGVTYPLYLLHWKIGKTIISTYSEYEKVSYFSIAVVLILILLSYMLSIYDYKIRKILRNKILEY